MSKIKSSGSKLKPTMLEEIQKLTTAVEEFLAGKHNVEKPNLVQLDIIERLAKRCRKKYGNEHWPSPTHAENAAEIVITDNAGHTHTQVLTQEDLLVFGTAIMRIRGQYLDRGIEPKFQEWAYAAGHLLSDIANKSNETNSTNG